MSHAFTAPAPLARRLALAATIAVVGLGAALALLPGSASASYGQCAKGNFCAWDGYGGASPFLYFYDWNDANWHNDHPADGSGGISADRAQSVRNNGYSGAYQDVIFWENTNYTGLGYCADVGDHYDYLGYWDNKISSHQWVNNCTEGTVYRRSAAASKTSAMTQVSSPPGLALPGRVAG